MKIVRFALLIAETKAASWGLWVLLWFGALELLVLYLIWFSLKVLLLTSVGLPINDGHGEGLVLW